MNNIDKSCSPESLPDRCAAMHEYKGLVREIILWQRRYADERLASQIHAFQPR